MYKNTLTIALMIASSVFATSAHSQDCDCLTDRICSWLHIHHQRSNCCAKCGCSTGCCKVCKLVEEEREVSATCWGIQCEDFCVPGPGDTGCEHCETICADCAKNQKEKVCAKPSKLTWRDWLPNPCADVYTRKKLMKHVETKKVKGYKWVVEDMCDSCRNQEKVVEIPAETLIPQPPKVSGAVLLEPTITQ